MTYLDAAGLAPGGEDYSGCAAAAAAVNPHLFAPFAGAAEQMNGVDRPAATDLTRWARAQRLEREEPQVAYELGLLALGVTLPPVLVRSLRELEMSPATRVAELPDGAGYPTVFLGTLHPHWPAGDRCTLLVTSTDARQLAAWSLLLLTRRLAPREGAIVVVGPQAADAPVVADVGLLYNTPRGLEPRALVHAPRFVVV